MGSLHQGDSKFGITAGVQCPCYSLLAICWSKIQDRRIWKKDNLDHVFNEGDQLYKSLSAIDLLSLNDVPHTMKLFNMEININFLH